MATETKQTARVTSFSHDRIAQSINVSVTGDDGSTVSVYSRSTGDDDDKKRVVASLEAAVAAVKAL